MMDSRSVSCFSGMHDLRGDSQMWMFLFLYSEIDRDGFPRLWGI